MQRKEPKGIAVTDGSRIDNLARDENAGRETAGCVRDEARVRVVSDGHIGYRICKRCFDLVISLAAGIVLLIPMLLLMALIVIKDPGCPLYFHERVGKGGRQIHVAKLRTMRKGADDLQAALTPEQIKEYRREYKIEDDPRLIGWKKPGDGKRCFGAKLRQLSLDEVPQIYWNVLIKGDMSIVGPRPILWSELEENYTPEQRAALLAVKPGVTGYWQAYARNDAKYGAGGGKATDGDVLSRASKPGLRSENHICDDAVGAAAQREVGAASGEARAEDAAQALYGTALKAKPLYRLLKRTFDIIASGLALILLSPVLLLTALAIKIEDPKGKVFYNAPRGGKDGVPFICHKFRSMCSTADDIKASLMAQNEMNGPVFKIKNDPRVTRVGRFIRKTSIDELPQLYDVLRGKMSLVGPRPLPVAEEDGVTGAYKMRELVKPGITCIWQVSGRNDIDFDQWMEMDLEYVQKRSLLFDLKLLILTIPAVLSNRGAS